MWWFSFVFLFLLRLFIQPSLAQTYATKTADTQLQPQTLNKMITPYYRFNLHTIRFQRETQQVVSCTSILCKS